MKIIVTHNSPDWDAISSVWLLKKFLSGWEEAKVEFVPAGTKNFDSSPRSESVIENIRSNEIIHVDTGLGPLDHHQTSDSAVCAASRVWDYVRQQNQELRIKNNDKIKIRIEAIDRIVKIIVAIDHFQEVFWENPTADYHEFSLLGVLEGLKVEKPNQDLLYVVFGIQCLESLVHEFENRIWAEKEITENGIVFETRFGKGLAIETINDSVIKLAQKMGYNLVVRKDPRKGYVRIKVRPTAANGVSQMANSESRSKNGEEESSIDLTLVKEQLSKMDPQATWFLHVSKKMLLNGTPKNPKMIPTTLTLRQILNVVEKI